MLSVANELIMLAVVMLNVVLLNVVAPKNCTVTVSKVKPRPYIRLAGPLRLTNGIYYKHIMIIKDGSKVIN